MSLRIATVVLLFCGVVLGATTRPANPAPARTGGSPTTRPADKQPPATQPAMPSARDLAAKWLEQKKKQQNDLGVAFIDLNQEVVERPAGFTILGDPRPTVQSLMDRLHRARDDKDIRAVLITFGETDFNLAQAQEIRDALAEIRKAGKRTFVYADTYETAAYIAASGATDICMLSGGEIMIPGVGMETMFAKGLLDKVGVKADYIQIGQYKGADEQFTRTEPSKEMRGELNKILDSLYEQIVDGISYHRNITKNDVQDVINGVMVNGKVAKSRGLVDHLVDQDGLRDLMKRELGREVRLVHNYGEPERETLDLSSPMGLFGLLSKRPQESTKTAIALIHADGVIVDGEGGEGLLGGGMVGSDDLRKAFRVASRDPSVKAIVFRIDSPGGSAMASEVIWQAARRAAKEKPLIISIGSMAASGGYYVATAGDYIFADPSAIVGSIGVVGGKFVMKDLFNMLGVHTETFSRGTNADLFSMSQPFTDTQRRLVTQWMQQTYDQFVERVMTTRRNHIKDIDDVAHGRIFLAKQARQLGMVDELGGIEKALQYAADEASLKGGQYEVKVMPAPKTILDYLRGTDPDARMPLRPQMSVEGQLLFSAMPARAARMLRQQVQVLQLLQQRPVILVSPYVIGLR